MRTDSRLVLWSLVMATGFLETVALLISPLAVAPASIAPLLMLVVASGLLVLRQQRFAQQWLKRLIDFFEVVALFAAVSLMGCIASYLIAAGTHGYGDALLARMDEALGLDWPAAYRLTMRSTVVQRVGGLAYSFGMLMPLLFLPLLCAGGRGALARRFILAFGIALGLTMLLFALIPAAGPVAHYGLGHGPYRPQTGLEQRALIESLRANGEALIDLDDLHGLVSFPSFHAAAAVLMLWAAPWFGRFKRLVQGVLLLLLAATPVEGNHYFVDLLAGAANALVAIRLSRVRGWAGRPAWPRLRPRRRASLAHG